MPQVFCLAGILQARSPGTVYKSLKISDHSGADCIEQGHSPGATFMLREMYVPAKGRGSGLLAQGRLEAFICALHLEGEVRVILLLAFQNLRSHLLPG